MPDDQRAGVLRECLAARRADTRMPARPAAAKDAQKTQKMNSSDALTGEMAARTLPPLCLSIPNRANAARFSFLCPRPSVRASEKLSRDSCPAADGDSHMRRPTAPGRGQGYDGLHRKADERCVRRRAGESCRETGVSPTSCVLYRRTREGQKTRCATPVYAAASRLLFNARCRAAACQAKRCSI